MDRRKKTSKMNPEDIKGYIKKLEDLEKNFSAESLDDFDPNFVDQLNNVLNLLNDDVVKETAAANTVDPTPETYQNNGILVKVKKLHDNAVIPSYSKIGDAGMDLTAVDIEFTDDYISYKTGLAFEIPKGYVGLLFPRSSNCKQDLLLTNSVGVIDSGYRGEVELRFKRVNSGYKQYSIGDRVGQILILPYPQVYMTQVPELSNSERGSGGFGSTGN